MEIIQQGRSTETSMIAINMGESRQYPPQELMYGNLNIVQILYKFSSMKKPFFSLLPTHLSIN